MKGPLAPQALRDLQEREVQRALLGPLGFQADLGLRVLPGQLERKGLLVRKGHKAQLAEMVFRVLWGFLVLLAPWVPLEKMGTRERSESPGRKEARVTKASRVLLAPRVPKAPLDSQAPPERMESRALVVSRASLGRKEMKAREVSLGPQGRWGCRVCQDLQVKRVRQGTWARWALPVPPAHEDPPELQVLTAHRAPQEE